MEFWGVEVKAGQPLVVKPDVGRVVHISQASLGEGKKEKGNELIPLRVKINGEKFVVGSLSVEKFPQFAFDLVFEKDFELSHDWKNGSVYFCGYSADNPYAEDEDDFDSEDSDEDEDIPLSITENGKIEAKGAEVKPAAGKGNTAKIESYDKPKVTVVELKKDDESDEDDEEDEDESDDDKDMMDASDDIGDSEDEDDSEGEDDSEDEDEETPKKVEPSKKRATQSATKTPVPAKKAKLDTPQRTDGKKGGHTATPYPSKQAGKTAANSNKSKEQTPKSDGKVSCKSCPKVFNSESALQSHTKAKHGGK